MPIESTKPKIPLDGTHGITEHASQFVDPIFSEANLEGMSSSSSPLAQAIARLADRKGELLEFLGSVEVDVVTVRRLREAIGLPPDPKLGVPMMAVANLFRPDAQVSHDVRPHETIDASLRDPVNGGTEVIFARPLKLGETISGKRFLADAFLREGKRGELAIVVTETRYYDAGESEIACVRLSMIYREATV